MCKKTTKQRSNRPTQLTKYLSKTSLGLGFSLIELLFTIALLGILLGLAFPVYRHLIAELRLFILTERIKMTIHYARSEAIRRQSLVTICKSKDRKTCSGRWQDGWIVFLAKNPSDLVDSATLLRVYPALGHMEFLVWHGFRSHDYLQWRPDGSTYGQNGSFIICVGVLSKKVAWSLKVSQTGRLWVDKKNAKYSDCND
ncbi:MAG: type 4 pili biosis protein [Pseudomonadota bacterium]